MQFNSQSNDENEVETKLREYLVSANLKKIRYENFENLPYSEVEKLISDKDYESEYQKRTIKFLFNKKEIKLTNEFQEAKDTIKETVEEIFNSEVIVNESEIESLFQTEFILEKLSPIIQEYLSENE